MTPAACDDATLLSVAILCVRDIVQLAILESRDRTLLEPQQLEQMQRVAQTAAQREAWLIGQLNARLPQVVVAHDVPPERGKDGR